MKYTRGFEFDIDRDPYEWAQFSITSKPTKCCGLYSVHGIGMGFKGEKIMLEMLNKHVRNRRGRKLGFIATLVEGTQLLNVFLGFGFKTINVFKNPNTNNYVHILFYQNG